MQLYIIFNCIIGLDDSRREASKIKALVFPGASSASDSLSVGTLYMDNHGMPCFPILLEGQVKVERHRVQFLGLHSLRQHIYPELWRTDKRVAQTGDWITGRDAAGGVGPRANASL